MNQHNKKTSRLPLIAFASLPLTVGLVFAQQSGASTATDPSAQAQRVQPTQPGRPQTQPGQMQPRQTQPNQATPAQPRAQENGTNYTTVFLQKLAAQLGISVEKLKAAAISAGSATIDQGVKAGDFPSDRAAELKQFLQRNPFAIGGGRGPGGPGMRPDGGGRGGPRGDHQHDQNGNDVQGSETAAPSAATSDDGI